MKKFKQLFEELNINKNFREISWKDIREKVFGEKLVRIPNIYWILKRRIVRYLNKKYPRLFLGSIDVTASPIQDIFATGGSSGMIDPTGGGGGGGMGPY